MPTIWWAVRHGSLRSSTSMAPTSVACAQKRQTWSSMACVFGVMPSAIWRISETDRIAVVNERFSASTLTCRSIIAVPVGLFSITNAVMRPPTAAADVPLISCGVFGFFFCIMMLLVPQKRSGSVIRPNSFALQSMMSSDQRSRFAWMIETTAWSSSRTSWLMIASIVFDIGASNPSRSDVRCRFSLKLEPVMIAAPAGLRLTRS